MYDRPRVSVSIINYNDAKYIVPCLEALLAQKDVDLECVLLDNGSTDHSLQRVREGFPGIRIIENGRNLGFAAAHNIGFRETHGEWHLVLNSDAFLEPDYLITCIAEARSRERIGSITGKLVRIEKREDKDVLDSCGTEMFASRRTWDRGTEQLDEGQYDETEEVLGCCAAAALYRRDVVEQISPPGEIFADIFISGYEDTDLSWRMAACGWHTLYVPQARARHVRSGSTSVAKVRLITFRNRYILLARNDSLRDLLRDFFPVAAMELLQLARAVRHPSLLMCLPDLARRLRLAFRQRRRMRKTIPRFFGLRPLRRFIVSGTGATAWIKQAGREVERKRDGAPNLPQG